MSTYYILQGVLLQTCIIAVVEYYTNTTQNKLSILKQEGIPLLKYLLVTFLSGMCSACVEEFVCRYWVYNKIGSYLFPTSTEFALLTYFICALIVTTSYQLNTLFTIVYLCQSALSIYLYHTTGTLIVPIFINAYGRLFRL